jgi:nucleoside-diphosphate-sugar epimerase
MNTNTNTKTVTFIGASGGVGLSALKHTLAAGHQCIALCRTPSKLTSIFPPESTPNLKVIEGNAHDVQAVSKCLLTEDGKLVDLVLSTIGSRPNFRKMTIEDPECCRNGAAALLEALDNLQRDGATGSPHLITFSTTGISRFGRDYPLAVFPIYHWMLKVPHVDKRITEDRFSDSGRPFTIVRASLLTTGETTKEVRVGIEDPKTGRESEAIGYFISREDSGKWVAENLILKTEEKYVDKIAMITN